MQTNFGDRLHAIDSRLIRLNEDFQRYLANKSTSYDQINGIRDRSVKLHAEYHAALFEKVAAIKPTNSDDVMQAMTADESAKMELLAIRFFRLDHEIGFELLSAEEKKRRLAVADAIIQAKLGGRYVNGTRTRSRRRAC